MGQLPPVVKTPIKSACAWTAARSACRSGPRDAGARATDRQGKQDTVSLPLQLDTHTRQAPQQNVCGDGKGRRSEVIRPEGRYGICVEHIEEIELCFPIH